MTLARQNLSKDAEDAINQQILTELTASYTYLAMSNWLSRDTVALNGLAEYFRGQSKDVINESLGYLLIQRLRNMNMHKNLFIT